MKHRALLFFPSLLFAHSTLSPSLSALLLLLLLLLSSWHRRGYDQLVPYFEDMLESQGWFDTREQTDKLLESYLDSTLKKEFEFEEDDMPGIQKWHELQEKVKNYNIKNVRVERKHTAHSMPGPSARAVSTAHHLPLSCFPSFPPSSDAQAWWSRSCGAQFARPNRFRSRLPSPRCQRVETFKSLAQITILVRDAHDRWMGRRTPSLSLAFPVSVCSLHSPCACSFFPASFCSVHPKTGKVCIPINPAEADGFDCNAVPVSFFSQQQHFSAALFSSLCIRCCSSLLVSLLCAHFVFDLSAARGSVARGAKRRRQGR